MLNLFLLAKTANCITIESSLGGFSLRNCVFNFAWDLLQSSGTGACCSECEISGSHGDEYEDRFMGYCAV
jgi:hypothetical protein